MSGCGGCGQKRLELARELEREYGCERCHQAPATEMFDRQFVCSPCREKLNEKLQRELGNWSKVTKVLEKKRHV
jgi:hypothetical protein